MSYFPNGQQNRFNGPNHSLGGQSGDFSTRPPPVISSRPPFGSRPQPLNPPRPPVQSSGGMNPMMKMMMSMMKSNPNVDSDWVEFCLPRMMEQMQQMSEEFKRKKMVDMISNDDFDQIKMALAGMGQVKHPGQTNEQNATNFRRMVGALAMKGKTPSVPPGTPPATDVQIDPKIQKNRLIIQMRNNLRFKYQILYYAKECKEMLLKIEREIQSTDAIFEKGEKEDLSRLLEISRVPIDQNNQKEFKFNFGRIKEICERVLNRLRGNLSKARSAIDSGSKSLSDFRDLLQFSFQAKQASNICVLISNCELAVIRINALPDIHCVDNWGKMWCQLWKLNVVRNPSASAFAGPDGDLLKEMFSLFKSDYAILVEKLTPLGQVSADFGVSVEMEHLKPDAELLKQALIPKDPKKGSQINELLYQQLEKRLNEAENEADISEKYNDELEMHAKLLKESKNSRDALKRLKNWLGENFNKPLIRKSLLERLESIQQSLGNLSDDHHCLLKAIFTHLEEKRGWLADRFDALEEPRLVECSVQLTVVILTAKSDCIINLLGGSSSQVGQALTFIRKHKTPIELSDQLVAEIISLIKSEEDVKNEDEIDLNDISDEEDEPEKAAIDLKAHLKGLINKVDGLNDDTDEPKFEAISSDEDDDQPDFHAALAPPPPPNTLPREEISDSDDDDDSNLNGFRIQAIDNTSVQDYSNIMFNFGHNRSFGFFAGNNTETHPTGSFYEKLATKKSSQTVDEFEREYYSKTTSNFKNLTLILTPGDSTPTYDEPHSSADETSKKKHSEDSAEEGECNDDGVELKPSLRIRNLPSPNRDQIDSKNPRTETKSTVSLRRVAEESPEALKKGRRVTLYKKKTKEVSLEDIKREEISSDEEPEAEASEIPEISENNKLEEAKTQPEVKPAQPEIIQNENHDESIEKKLDDSTKSENSNPPKEIAKVESTNEREERKRKKSERKEAKRAKKEAKKAKKEKKRADRQRRKSERSEKSIDKIEEDDDEITDTEDTPTDYTNIEVTKLDIIDGLNSNQTNPANLNEDPVLKREAEKRKEKIQRSIHDIPPPPPPGKPPKKTSTSQIALETQAPPPPPPKIDKRPPKASILAPPPPPPPRKPVEGPRVVMKGQTLKEALEYVPSQQPKKFTALTADERVKRLKQELADMEKLMRTGIGSSSLASGPSSAPGDEYIPLPTPPKKLKKPKKRERPPPPPPKREVLTLPIAHDIPPPPSGPPPKKVKETKLELETAPPPPPPRKPDETESVLQITTTDGQTLSEKETERDIPEAAEATKKPDEISGTQIEMVTIAKPQPSQVAVVRKREPSFSKEPLKKRILSDFPSEDNDPFDSFGAAGPKIRTPRPLAPKNDISDSEFGPPLPGGANLKPEENLDHNEEDEWVVKPQTLKRSKIKSKKEKKEKRKKDTDK